MQDTIHKIKELNEKRTRAELRRCHLIRVDTKAFPYRADWEFVVAAANTIMPLINAYEESQKEVRQAERVVVESVKICKALQSAVNDLLGAVEPFSNYTDWSEAPYTMVELEAAKQTFTKHKHLRSCPRRTNKMMGLL